MTEELKAYSVQVLTRFDAYTGKVLRRYYTREYRRVLAVSADQAETSVYCGPFDAIGKVSLT